jgi:DNA-binding CsgD family transcriptional regulator
MAAIRGVAGHGAGSGGIVGRDPEVAAIESGLARGRGVALVGAPGMGTSALTRHAADRWAASGRPVVHLTAMRAMRAVPLGALAPLLPAGGHLDGGLDSVRGVRGALLEAFTSVPTAVVVDDAQELDELSVAVLAQLTPDVVVPVLAVRTADAREQTPAALAPLLGHDHVDRIDLAALADDAISEIVQAELGLPVSGRALHRLRHLSSGAPAIAVALARAAVSEGALVEERGAFHPVGALPLPAPLVASTGQLADELSRRARTALELLALAEPLRPDVLDGAAGAAAVDELDRLGLVRTTPAPAGDECECARPLVSAALRETMSARVRAARARALVTAFEQVADEREGDLATVAGLRLAAGDRLGRDDALAAARRAQTLGRFDLAEQLARSVVGARGDVEASTLLAELLALSGRSREAERLLSTLQPVEESDVALWAMTRATTLFYMLEEVDRAAAVLRDGRARVAGGPWEAELIGLGAVFELFLGRPRHAIELAEPHLGAASGRNLVEAITAAAPALVVTGQHDEAARLAAVGFEQRVALGDQQMLSSPGLHVIARALACGDAGALQESLDLCDLVWEEAIRQGSRDGQMWADLTSGRALLSQGRLDDARAAFEEAAVLAADLDYAGHVRWGRAGALLAVAQQGDVEATLRAEAALAASAPTVMRMLGSEVPRARAWAAVVVGDLAEARVRFRRAADEARSIGETALEVLALHDLVRLGDSELADRLVDRCAVVDGPLAAARARHAEAVVARDVGALEAAGDAFAAIGAWLFSAEAVAQAAALARRGGAASRSDALTRRVDELLTRCQRVATPALVRAAGTHDLTGREREVALLAARGMRSKEVAAQLDISVRTVDNLLQRAYRKLGVTSRAELRPLLDPAGAQVSMTSS